MDIIELPSYLCSLHVLCIHNNFDSRLWRHIADLHKRETHIFAHNVRGLVTFFFLHWKTAHHIFVTKRNHAFEFLSGTV